MFSRNDDIYVDIDLSEPFREAFIEGYKLAILQNKGEWVSDAVEFAKWIHTNYNAAHSMKWMKRNIDDELYTTEQLYKEFKNPT